MRFKFFNSAVFLVAYILAPVAAIAENSDTQIKIIERPNFQKWVSVEKLTNVTDGLLKNYTTFSFQISDKLIFCHVSNDKSSPRVICH